MATSGPVAFASVSGCTFSPTVISSYGIRDLSNIDISFNNTVYNNPTVPPNLTGITYWYGNPFPVAAGLDISGFKWRTQMIYPSNSGVYPTVTMNWDSIQWVLTISYGTFTSAPFTGIGNTAAGYGYILNITIIK